MSDHPLREASMMPWLSPQLGSQLLWTSLASQAALVVENTSASARNIRDAGSIPGSGRSPREGYGNPLQYSCLENPMDRGAWQAIVRSVAKSRTWLKRLSTQAPWKELGKSRSEAGLLCILELNPFWRNNYSFGTYVLSSSYSITGAILGTQHTAVKPKPN